MTGQRGYAALAAACLEEADRSGDLDYRSKQAGYSQVNVLRGIGYAILSLREQLADQFADLSDAVVAVADQVGDLAVPVDQLASNPGVVRAVAKGPGKSRYLRDFFHRHPGARVRVYDLKDPDEAAAWTRDQIGLSGLLVQASDGAVTLAAGELATVRQALQDAAAWRSARAWCGDCGDDGPCARHAHDERLADEDRAPLARLRGGDVS